MTRRRELAQHRESLGEIREIMGSMKTLAYMETRKLGRFLDTQRTVVQSISEVAADFLGFFGDALPDRAPVARLFLLVGTERGFCGDFNHAILRRMETELDENPVGQPLLLPVGHKLHVLLEKEPRVAALIPGASVAEEVTASLSQVTAEIGAIQAGQDELAVYCIHHSDKSDTVVRQLLPPFLDGPARPAPFSFPPLLQEEPLAFLSQLADHYLLAVLYEIFYTSLMAENDARLAHLGSALRHLDEQSEELARQDNILRQEEIIEEIEVLLLSSGPDSGHPV
jgi:F-type H+-transporting ATPase subunit gamma